MRSGAFCEKSIAAVAAALIWILSITSVAAQMKDTDLFARPDDLRTALFGSLDAGHSGFLTVGYKHTLAGPIDRTGPVSMASVGYGLKPERIETDEGPALTLWHTVQTSALIGYQWAFSRVVVAGYVGTETEAEQPTVNGAVARWSAPRGGFRVQGEVWARPTENTFATATVIAGTARAHLWTRAALGYRLWRDVFIGPEASLSLAETYREWRVGAHLTGLQLGRFTVSLSGGWRSEAENPQGGAYVNLSGYIRM